ncbi:hypothetical protein NLG97_g4165 [Lecanicillium saksenae]|uniref:Uncharacterized protein n=1 Tax=Lecanicillium saksenae TaxID=468837 RepID=A0ACC1QYN6_9HYPO|nr:hypothetical protein NLG97_g4165 [Lecanicillium saksenae]
MSGYAAEMQVRNNVRMLYSRMQTLLNRRSKQKRTVEISAPFDLKLEPVSLPGVSQDELAILREKATASRVGHHRVHPPLVLVHDLVGDAVPDLCLQPRQHASPRSRSPTSLVERRDKKKDTNNPFKEAIPFFFFFS